MFKKILSYVVVLTLVVSYFTYNVSASEDDSISLPVELFDFDADGLFYEYVWGFGMNLYGKGDYKQDKVTTGLVDSILGQDGKPVYTRDAVESAARTIYNNLISGKNNSIFNARNYDIFKKLADKGDPKGTGVSKVTGTQENGNYFYDKGWKLNNSNTPNGIVWQHNGDGVENHGIPDTLTKTFTNYEPNTQYEARFYTYTSNMSYTINGTYYTYKAGNGASNGFNTVEFTTDDTGKIIFNITSSGASFNKFAKLTICKPGENHDLAENLLGNIYDSSNSSDFIAKGWNSSRYTANENKILNCITNGNAWKQKGDGIICLSANSPITLDTQIKRGQSINLRYWLDDLGENNEYNNVFQVDILDSNNNVIIDNVQLNEGKGNHFDTNIDIPDGEGTIKIRLKGKVGYRIADFDITPKGNVTPIGNYDETKSKYNQGRLNRVEDCTTCMDYAYLRLTHFFDTDFYLNKKDDSYKTMILNKEVTRNTASYAFNSSNKTIYDRNNKKLYNTNGSSNGFFPLDHTGNEHLKRVENDPQSEKHNYHFGMIVDGYFVYNKDANQFFTFSGDDDVYVFINGKLAVDLGGAHQEKESSININDDFADEYGLVEGQKTSFKLFYLERHTSESNCKIQTNLNISKNVGYEFVSGTEGKELPEEVLNQAPVDNKDYFDGNTVQVTNKTFNDVVVADGVWKFIGWNNNSITIPNDNTFVGTWVFTPKSVDDDNNDSTTGDEDDKDDTPTIEGDDKDDKKEEVTDNKDTDNKDTNNKVKTGDSTVISVYLVMMMVACLGIIHVLKKD